MDLQCVFPGREGVKGLVLSCLGGTDRQEREGHSAATAAGGAQLAACPQGSEVPVCAMSTMGSASGKLGLWLLAAVSPLGAAGGFLLTFAKGQLFLLPLFLRHNPHPAFPWQPAIGTPADPGRCLWGDTVPYCPQALGVGGTLTIRLPFGAGPSSGWILNRKSNAFPASPFFPCVPTSPRGPCWGMLRDHVM